MTTISLKIPEDLVSRVDAMARAKRTSRSALLRETLEEKLKTAARNAPPSLYELSADLCGMGEAAAWVIWPPTHNTLMALAHE